MREIREDFVTTIILRNRVNQLHCMSRKKNLIQEERRIRTEKLIIVRTVNKTKWYTR